MKKTLLNIIGATIVSAGLGSMAYLSLAEYRNAAVRDAAERAARVLYEPVGNGGALSAIEDSYNYMHNRPISERRQRMYDLMHRVYDAAVGRVPKTD